MPDLNRITYCLMLVTWLFGCQPDHAPKTNSNTNWLLQCEVTEDCEGDGACICGLCTRTCDGNADCTVAGPRATCVEPAEAITDEACAAIVQNADEKLCLATCETEAQCGSESSCVAGACWRTPSAVVDLRDGGTGDTSTGGPLAAPVLRGIDASTDLSALDAAVDFGQPVLALVPETTIQGELAAASLAGVWEQVPGANTFWGGPLRLEIVETPSTGLTGTLSFMCSPGLCEPEGPPPPATDPEAGYPPGLDPIQQDLLRTNVLPRTPYRMLDGRLANGSLTFWFTNNDLWRDWCALQTPHHIELNGRQLFSCIANPEPCVDFIGRSPDDIAGKELLCCAESALCRCDATHCEINYQSGVHTFDFVVEGDTMQGIMVLGGDTFRSVLNRVQGAQP